MVDCGVDRRTNQSRYIHVSMIMTSILVDASIGAVENDSVALRGPTPDVAASTCSPQDHNTATLHVAQSTVVLPSQGISLVTNSQSMKGMEEGGQCLERFTFRRTRCHPTSFSKSNESRAKDPREQGVVSFPFLAAITTALLPMNNYVVERELAPAMYGDVLLCTDKSTNTRVVIKRSHLDAVHARQSLRRKVFVYEDIYMERIALEALRAAGGHAHIVEFHTSFVDAGMDHCVLEYCSRGELFHEVQRAPGRRFPPSRARHCFHQIAHAVSFVHAHGFAHGDLSLENVFVDADGNCKIGDFGLASHLHNAKAQCAGKPHYMAPEMYLDRAYDPAAADVWALGIVLFTIVTGHALVERASPSNEIFQFLKTKGLRVLCRGWGIDTRFSPDAMELLVHMLTVDPKERYTIDQVAAHRYCRARISHGPAAKNTSDGGGTPRKRSLWRQLFRRFLAADGKSMRRV
ncbi:Aste57867_12107 [Aphanomyces stellatus]|uniref:Aste57867_12107 protein n=1 Tax=Aphanomyces stellatus TaxID=120398 RepID=A0A485KVW8_9STRA|nr:hypothetical protein As57867_012062 [Aphanomyces stellatus]VFT88961.1 Aste57867_12107 [Aphanomyces stellatus]